MTGKTDDRLVVAFENIAKALDGILEQAQRAGIRYWPDQPIQKEAVLTRVPNAEDEARKNLGITDGPIEDWLVLEDDGGVIGERSRQWIIDHPEEAPKAEVSDAGAETPSERKAVKPNPKKAKGKA
jgi:hypothetical protein